MNGSTDGLALAANAFLGPGDGGIVEAATYPHTRRFMAATGATIHTAPMDDDGLVVDALPAILDTMRGAGVTPKLLYTIPTFHAPTGTVLTPQRRRSLVALAAEQHIVVLEDNCYHGFAYDEPPPPTLRAYDDAGLVLQSDSFSKYVAPGLRMAWLAGHPAAIDAVVKVRQDFAVSPLLARALERYLADGAFDRHVEQLRLRYRTKRDLTAAALARPLRVARHLPRADRRLLLLAPDLAQVDWDQARRNWPPSGWPSAPVPDSSTTGPTRASCASPRSRSPTPTSRSASPRWAGPCTRRARPAKASGTPRRLAVVTLPPPERPEPTGSDPLAVAAAFAAAWDAHDLEATLALVTDDCIFESARPEVNGDRVQGREALRSTWGPSFVAGGGTMEVEETFAAGDRVVQCWRFVAGTQVVRGVDVLRVRDGKICEKLGYVKV